MRKVCIMLLALLLALGLCACGTAQENAAADPEASDAGTPADSETPAPEQTDAGEDGMQSVLPDAGLHEAEEAPGTDAELAVRIEKARSFLDKDVSALIAELGEPLERDYAPSCLGSGEDGELRYEGFTVYTYRENGQETVSDVEADEG